MMIGYARVSTSEQNVGSQLDDPNPATDASVDQTDARQRSLGRPGAAERGQRAASSRLPDSTRASNKRRARTSEPDRRERPNDEILRFVCFPRGRRPGSALI
jgi:hypothetical protein